MQNQNSNGLTLAIITPDEEAIIVTCDAIRVTLGSDAAGKGGGSYGIHPGHTRAILALDPGPVTAYREGETILRKNCAGGFAKIEENRVNVVTEQAIDL